MGKTTQPGDIQEGERNNLTIMIGPPGPEDLVNDIEQWSKNSGKSKDEIWLEYVEDFFNEFSKPESSGEISALDDIFSSILGQDVRINDLYNGYTFRRGLKLPTVTGYIKNIKDASGNVIDINYFTSEVRSGINSVLCSLLKANRVVTYISYGFTSEDSIISYGFTSLNEHEQAMVRNLGKKYKHKLATVMGTPERANELNNGCVTQTTFHSGRIVNSFLMPVTEVSQADIVILSIGRILTQDEFTKLDEHVDGLTARLKFNLDDLGFATTKDGINIFNISFGKIDHDTFLEISDRAGYVLGAKEKELFRNEFDDYSGENNGQDTKLGFSTTRSSGVYRRMVTLFDSQAEKIKQEFAQRCICNDPDQ